MIVTEQPHNDRKCTVIHFTSDVIDAAVKEEEVDIFKEGDNVFRIKYPERCAPDQGIGCLRRSLGVILSAHSLACSMSMIACIYTISKTLQLLVSSFLKLLSKLMLSTKLSTLLYN